MNGLRSHYKRTAPDWQFVAVFGAYLAVLLLLTQFPLSLLQELKVITGKAVAFSSSLLLLQIKAHDDIVQFQAFPMQITLECTALHYGTFFTAGVLAQRQSLRYKVLGLALGNAAVFLLNIVRIVILGVIGQRLPWLFEFVHIYLWQGAFALITLLIWISWSDRKSPLSVFMTRYVAVGSIAALLTLVLLFLHLQDYAIVLARTAGGIVDYFSGRIGIPFTVEAAGRTVLYAAQHATIYNTITDVFNTPLFAAIAAVLVVRGRGRLLPARIALGAGILFLQHVFYVVLYGFMLMNQVPDHVFSTSLWSLHGLSMAAPFIIWAGLLNLPRGTAPR